MQSLKIDQDIKPLSEMKAGIASFVKQVHDTKRPLVITQRGKSVAVLMDAHEYETMRETLELLTDIHISMTQIENGHGVDHEEAKIELLKRFQK